MTTSSKHCNSEYLSQTLIVWVVGVRTFWFLKNISALVRLAQYITPTKLIPGTCYSSCSGRIACRGKVQNLLGIGKGQVWSGEKEWPSYDMLLETKKWLYILEGDMPLHIFSCNYSRRRITKLFKSACPYDSVTPRRKGETDYVIP